MIESLKEQLQQENGVTLIELMAALALMAVVLVGAFGIFHLVQVSYERSRAFYTATNAAEKVVAKMETDLRSAVAPNDATDYPVRVITATTADSDNPGVAYKAGQRIDIYTIVRKSESDPDDGSISATSDRYKRIRYSVEADGRMRRGWVRQSAQPSGANPLIAAISNWQDIASGISDAAGTDVPAGIFSEAGSPISKSQRLVTLNFWVRDTQNQTQQIEPIAVNTRILSGF